LLCCSCPFDYVNVYDGADNESAVIGTYCGQQRNLVLYSSESSLLVTFVTLQRTASTQNRGFKGIFEFSESFVKLGMFCISLTVMFCFSVLYLLKCLHIAFNICMQFFSTFRNVKDVCYIYFRKFWNYCHYIMQLIKW